MVRPARAGDAAVAQELFVEAKALMRRGDWAAARPKLEESERLEPAIGTEFNLADCNEHLGRTASAWSGFLAVASSAKASGQSARESAARVRAATLEPRLARITLVVVRADEGLRVQRDGVDVGRAQWDSPVPVDPGEHVFVVTVPGKMPWKTTVSVRADGPPVRVEVPALPAAPAPPEPDEGQAQVQAVRATADRPPTEPSPNTGSTRRVVGAVLAGVGLIGLGVGTGFAIVSKAMHDDAVPHCRGDVCNAEGASLRDNAIAAGNRSTVSVVGGGVMFVGGGLLWLTAPSVAAPHGGVQALPMVGSAGSGLTVRGAW